MEARPAMTLLTSVAGTFRAHVLLARLESEGIDAQLRGATSGPYGVTVGDLARVDVYVPDDQPTARGRDDQRRVDEALAAPSPGGIRAATTEHRTVAVVVALLLAVALSGPLLGWLNAEPRRGGEDSGELLAADAAELPARARGRGSDRAGRR
jgi:hypothetical protein